jgi:hypothetical protein
MHEQHLDLLALSTYFFDGRSVARPFAKSFTNHPFSCRKPLIELKPAAVLGDVSGGDRHGLPLTGQHDQLPSSGSAGVALCKYLSRVRT